MNWIDSAILAAALLAVVNVVDSHLISRRLPSLQAFLFPVGIIALFYGIVVSLSVPIEDGAETKHVLYAVGSSFIRALGVGSFLYAMKKAEVSRIIPIVNTKFKGCVWVQYFLSDLAAALPKNKPTNIKTKGVNRRRPRYFFIPSSLCADHFLLSD